MCVGDPDSPRLCVLLYGEMKTITAVKTMKIRLRLKRRRITLLNREKRVRGEGVLSSAFCLIYYFCGLLHIPTLLQCLRKPLYHGTESLQAFPLQYSALLFNGILFNDISVLPSLTTICICCRCLNAHLLPLPVYTVCII